MRRVAISFAVLIAFVLPILTVSTLAQKRERPAADYPFPAVPDYPFPGYPPEFSPLRTSRPAEPKRSLTPATKFVRFSKHIPNHYIVVLKDDLIDRAASLSERNAAVRAIAEAHAKTYLGKIGFIYETALVGYSIELPNEAAAIALSCNPQVQWVEEEAIAELF